MSNQPEQKTDQNRDRQGQFTRDPVTAQRDADAARLRSTGHTYKQIAAELGCSLATAYTSVQRAMDAIIREPAEAAIASSLRNLAEARARIHDARARLEGHRDTVLETLSRQHVTVSQGRVVYDEDTGNAVRDDEFILKAVDRLNRIEAQLQTNEAQLQSNDESRRRLEGLDQPGKQHVTGGVTYEIVGITPDQLT